MAIAMLGTSGIICRSWRGVSFLPSLQKNTMAVTTKASAMSSSVIKGQEEMHEFWVKNETMKRPMSPHLTIWRWQLPMNTSLMHRVTGCAMTTALFGFGYGTFILSGDYTTYLNMIKDMNMGPALITSAKFILAYPVAYHSVNGIRHLSWDAGRAFDMKTIYMTGWTAFLGAVVIAAAITQL